MTADDGRVGDDYTSCCAYENGYLSVAQWLEATFGLTLDT
jgi:hypothetical protein